MFSEVLGRGTYVQCAQSMRGKQYPGRYATRTTQGGPPAMVASTRDQQQQGKLSTRVEAGPSLHAVR